MLVGSDDVRYRTIVADPPWDVGRGPEWASNGASRPLTYPTMTVEEIAALPVADLADKRAHLYIWTINAYVEDTYEIARHWGFRPSTLLTWAKAPNGIGLGGTYSLTTEHVLFCRRGVLKAATRIDSTWWEWSRGRHSQKPEAFLDMVEAVSPPPRLEMFARRNRLGWSTWGSECLPHVVLESGNESDVQPVRDGVPGDSGVFHAEQGVSERDHEEVSAVSPVLHAPVEGGAS